MLIRPYQPADEAAVIDLWQRCDLTRPWNDPHKDIQRKLKVQPELFLVGEIDGQVVASAMAGYEGHRGWVNYLAVCPKQRQQGLARQLMAYIEEQLLAMGCPKLSLQVRDTNTAALAFYERLGYKVDASVSLGKRLIADD
ncbi:GNAT family acetyltransferase [Ectopseudomonas toyotomiensis]|uniref:GNAT family acetyltransferase n=1 Tax=Ectopseudomonas toyotomiensis TaxID=554344 RepID=UPI003D0F401A